MTNVLCPKKMAGWTFMLNMRNNLLELQGLLSTTYQVEVTFSVKGGAEEQKSIFVKVLKSKCFHLGSYHLFE